MTQQAAIAPREGIITQQVGDELILVDPSTDRAHALSGDAAAVWNAFDGRRGADQIAQAAKLSPERVNDVAAELDALGLVELPQGIGRRALLGRGALLGGAAVAAPAILSMAMPALAAADSMTVSSTFTLQNGGVYNDANEGTTVNPGQTLYVGAGDEVSYEQAAVAPPAVAFALSSASVVTLTFTESSASDRAYYGVNGGGLTRLTSGTPVTIGTPSSVQLAIT